MGQAFGAENTTLPPAGSTGKLKESDKEAL